MKYLKYLQTANDFESFKNSEDYVLPNVSYIEETKGVSYEPYVEPPFKMVDLGLPSGRLWCDRNIGAASPEDIGLFFQWGDVVGCTSDQFMNGEKRFAVDFSDYFDKYNEARGTFAKYNTTGIKTLLKADDAANVHMGAEYRMPTQDDFDELINNTTAYQVSIDGEEIPKDYWVESLKGVKLVGSNGNSIYIPSLNSIMEDDTAWNSDFRPDTIGNYSRAELWASTLDEYDNIQARSFNADKNTSKFPNTNSTSRYIGMPVRGVK